jgi:hypothetical protein
MKYTAIPMTAVLVVGIACVHELTKRRFANADVVAFACAIVASPWLVRNIAWTGNPVFPLATSVFGQAHFTDEQFERYRVAHRPPEAESGAAARVSNGWSRTAVDPQFGYVALFAGAFAVASLVIRKPRADGVVLAIMLIGMLGIWLGATHVMPRFITPIIPLLGLAIALVPVPGIAAVTVALTQFGIGLWLIWGWLSPELSGDRRVLLRLSDPSRLLPDDIERALRSDRPIALIGDAQAFWYPISSDRLIYRSVFDVRIAPGTPLVDGWLGESVESLRKRGAWVIINTPELTRLSQTYRHLPAPLPPFDQPVPGPIVLPPG